MKIAYFDCFSGASGDMLLSALFDAGLSFTELRKIIRKITPYKVVLSKHRVRRCGLSGLKIALTGADRHLSFTEISKNITKARLPENVKTTSLTILNRLGQAEAKVHSNNRSKSITLHELGSLDTLVDIVAVAFGIHYLGIESIYVSPLPLTSGSVNTYHGLYPLPAPATTEMLKGFELFRSNIKAELITPTGAAIISTLARPSKEMPEFNISRIGYGAGSLDIRSQPNILRVMIGETSDKTKGTETDTICVLETNIDNTTPEVIGYVVEKLFKAGALDVFTNQIQMKKSRPALLLKVLSSLDLVPRIEEIIFTEIPTLGIRKHLSERVKLKRESRVINTKYGKIRVKVSRYNSKVINITPEYDDCRRAAEKYNIPLRHVINALSSNP
jgi:uncharacterized protein (TIGR00299 family) protein